ncbi:MAG: hypothetical protein ACSHX5_03990 [Phycisphaerales bacterium]
MGNDTHYWQIDQSGNWLDFKNWSTGQVPNGQDAIAVFDIRGNYTATLSSVIDVGVLDIQHNIVNVALAPNAILRIRSMLTNDGVFHVNDQSSFGVAQLTFFDAAVLEGSGHVSLGAMYDPYESLIVSFGGIAKLRQPVLGSGVFQGDFLNSSSVSATDFENSGLIFDGRFSQTENGSVSIRTGVIEFKEESSLLGGHFELRTLSKLVLNSGVSFLPDTLEVEEATDLEIRSTMEHPFPTMPTERLLINGSQTTLILRNDYRNDGEIVLNEADDSRLAKLYAEDDIEINGNGLIDMRSPIGQGGTLGARAGSTLTIGKGQLIYGAGTIRGDANSTVVINTTARTSPGGELVLDGEINGGSFIADAGQVTVIAQPISNAQFRSENGGAIVLTRARLVNPVFVGDTPVEINGRNTDVTLFGSIVLKSDMLVEFDNGDLEFEPGSQLIGAGEIVLGGDGTRLSGEIRLPSTIQISGYGTMKGLVENESIISATSKLNSLTLSGVYLEGSYLADGGLMTLRGQHYGGEYVARGGALQLGTSRIYDARLYAEQGGEIRLVPDSGVLIENSMIDANLDLYEGAEVTLHGASFINGDHQILDDSSLIFQDGRLDGEGSIRIHTNTTSFVTPSIYVSEGTGTIGSGFTVRGSGVLSGRTGLSLVIEGDVIADDPYSPMHFRGEVGPINSFLIEGGSLELGNSLRLIQTRLRNAQGESGVTVSSEVHLINVVSDVELWAPTGEHQIQYSGHFENNSRVILGSDETNSGGLLQGLGETQILGEGVIELNGKIGLTPPARMYTDTSAIVGHGQRIEGEGVITGPHTILGTLAPGGESGLIRIGLIEFGPLATLEIDITGPGESDVLSGPLSQDVFFNGTLDLRINESYMPQFGDRWTILDGGDPIGLFSEIQSSYTLSNGWTFLQVNHDGGMDILVGCAGDRNGDGVRDFFDVFDFIGDLQDRSPEADLNFDGQFDFFDVTIFVQQYQQECQP